MRGPLPDTIAMGYADWGECDAKIMTAAAHGVNVIVWFALSMTLDASGVPHIGGGPNLTCVAKTAADLNSQGLPTHHLISIGGWNGAHPDPAASADAWWGALSAYDTAAEAAGLPGGFDGIDWDIEGNDSPSSTSNHFPPEELRLLARISELAKANGKLVAMVPAQSYLDASTSEFALDVLRAPHCGWHDEFKYHGRNAYAALLALAKPDTFDLVSLQLYESWSQANCMLSSPAHGGQGVGLAAYLDGLVRSPLIILDAP